MGLAVQSPLFMMFLIRQPQQVWVWRVSLQLLAVVDQLTVGRGCRFGHEKQRPNHRPPRPKPKSSPKVDVLSVPTASLGLGLSRLML